MVKETFSSLVASGEYIKKRVAMLTGIDNKTIKGAPTTKAVLGILKEFTNGYEVYARNSEFVNKFLFYYARKTNTNITLAYLDDYDEISKFINGIKSETLDIINETKQLATMLTTTK